jgi:hypothetical protein
MATSDTADRWPPDFPACIFLGRLAVRLSNEEIWRGLLSGELEAHVYCDGRTDFEPIPLSTMAFLRADRDQVLAQYKIEIRETDQRRPVAMRRAIPVPHWLFVTRGSVDKFLRSQPDTTVAAEARAIKHLAAQLRTKPDMTKNSARLACADFELGLRPFERVWPKARIEAGLPAQSRAGRKSRQKSKR